MEDWQTLLLQSEGAAQVMLASHEAQEPPQSTSVSVPLRMVSAHVGALHEDGVPEHAPLWQSLGPTQEAPVAQGEHEEPQSTSVSVPSVRPLEQDTSTPPSVGRHVPLAVGAPELHAKEQRSPMQVARP